MLFIGAVHISAPYTEMVDCGDSQMTQYTLTSVHTLWRNYSLTKQKRLIFMVHK